MQSCSGDRMIENDSMGAEPDLSPRAIGIAATGRRAGKSYVAQRLEGELNRLGYAVCRLAMATALRQAVSVFSDRLRLPIPAQALYDLKDRPLAESGASGWPSWLTGRDLLIAFGEAMVDTIGHSVWADAWYARAMDWLDRCERPGVVICDDVRRPAEAAVIRKIGGLVVFLENESAVFGAIEGLLRPEDCEYRIVYEPTEEGVERATSRLLAHFPPRPRNQERDGRPP